MNRFNKSWMVISVLAVVGWAWGQAATQPVESPARDEATRGAGTVTGDNVYVRSGSDMHYYPVLKLYRGDKVEVVGSEYGWLEIAPPKDAFSLVEKSRIDKADDETGVANDLVQVYAGSELDNRRYAKQVKLRRGEKVRIVGETAEGDFYKIAPPPGATLWISGDYVRRGASAEPSIEPVKPGELKQAQREISSLLPEPRPSDETPADMAHDEGPSGTSSEPPARPSAPRLDPDVIRANRDQMRAIEAEIADELRKPPSDQNLEPLVGKLSILAEQEEDITAQVYAKARIEQLQDQMELAGAVAEMKQLREQAISKADEIARQRAEIKARQTSFEVDQIAARGEIKVSGLYSGEGGRPKRWRLVDPKTNRTIAYLELAPGSPIDMVQYYGKYVGVRATSYQLMHGTVPPLPVYVVNRIEVQDPDRPTRSGGVRKEVIASPGPRLVDVPASQPSVSRAPQTRPAN